MYEARYNPRDSPQLKGLQTQQTADAEGGTHDWEAGKTAETWTREEAQTETSGDLYLSIYIKKFTELVLKFNNRIFKCGRSV